MPDMAVQTDVTSLPSQPYPTPPVTPEEGATPIRMRQTLDLYERRTDGSFVRATVPILPPGAQLATINLAVENLTIAAEKITVQTPDKDKSDEKDPFVAPAWVDNLGNNAYRPIRLICRPLKAILTSACYALWWIGPVGFGVNLGVFNIRSS